MTAWLRVLITGFAILFGTTGHARADSEPGKSSFHVGFLSNFNKDQVEVYIGNEKVYSSVITTEQTSGLAAWIDVPGNPSRINLKVNFPRLHLSKTQEFKIPDGGYIYVNLLDKKISLQQTQKPLALD